MTDLSAQTMLRNYERERRARERKEAAIKRLRTMQERYGAGALNGQESVKIRMYVSPWAKDEQGFPTRFIRQLGE
jgi:hypothetical protein